MIEPIEAPIPPTWKLMINTTGIKVISAEGAQPMVVVGSGPLPELVALVFPPPVTPPTTPPDEFDNSPFLWPAQPLLHDDAAQRYAGLGQGFYAGQTIFQNPLPLSNWFAGFIVKGTAGAWDLAGYRLWAPREAGAAVIRKALALGKI